MSRVEVRDLGEPEAVVSYPLGTSNQVRLAQTVVTRHVLQPGWSWEEHARPLVGTASCELYHRAVRSLVAALVTSSVASGHVVPVPQFLATGAVTTMSFAVPNERPEPMSGVTVSVPAGVRIVRTHPTAGWTAMLDGSTATWRAARSRI
jgi:hypothetical protein